jgi:hypothetical protein
MDWRTRYHQKSIAATVAGMPIISTSMPVVNNSREGVSYAKILGRRMPLQAQSRKKGQKLTYLFSG